MQGQNQNNENKQWKRKRVEKGIYDKISGIKFKNNIWRMEIPKITYLICSGEF